MYVVPQFLSQNWPAPCCSIVHFLLLLLFSYDRISDTLLYFGREVKRRRAEEANLWNEPQDVSHTERDDDRELYNLLQKRSRTRRGSEVS